jgi:hypothetical protein
VSFAAVGPMIFTTCPNLEHLTAALPREGWELEPGMTMAVHFLPEPVSECVAVYVECVGRPSDQWRTGYLDADDTTIGDGPTFTTPALAMAWLDQHLPTNEQ